MSRIIIAVLYIILAPFLGGLLAGVDRRISAHMQGRKGPPLLQPFYDVLKLLGKESIGVNGVQSLFMIGFALFMIFTGALFFTGGDLLLVIFALTLSSIFLVLCAFSANSPYSSIGAERELLQMMAYEPMVLMVPIGFYLVTKLTLGTGVGTFAVADFFRASLPAIVYLPGLFIGYLYILTIKLRKSPFDLSTSHHGHQEIVKGITTELSGRLLAVMEIAHWYENIFLIGIIFIFFVSSSPISWVYGLLACIVAYSLEILIDNTFARVKWQLALDSTWIVTATLGILNLLILYMIK